MSTNEKPKTINDIKNYKPINETITELRSEARRRLREVGRNIIKDVRKRQQRIEEIRLLLPEIVEIVGVDAVEFTSIGNTWVDYDLTIKLGEKPSSAIRQRRSLEAYSHKLVELTKLLGNLVEHEKDVADTKKHLVLMGYRCSRVKGVKVTMVAKLTKDAKCKIRRVWNKGYRSTQLVCET